MNMTLGKRIMLHRKQLGLTQDKLAEILGVTAQAVSKWENDQSCPDITMLPRLAEVFHITTDELLGVVKTSEEPEQAEPEEYVAALEGTVEVRKPGKEKHGFELNWEPGKRDAIFIACFVLFVGALTLYTALYESKVPLTHYSPLYKSEVSFWSILWPSTILAIGIRGFLKKFSFFSVICTLFGSYFLLENLNITDLNVSWKLVFPILILLLGISLLVDAFKQPKRGRWHFHRGADADKTAVKSAPQNDYFIDGEAFTISLSFGDADHYVSMPKFSAGDVSCSFGDLSVDLSGVEEFSKNCHITANCSFGDLELRVPRHIKVEPNTSTSFASVNVEGVADAVPRGILYLEAIASFGEITICYI